MPRPLDLLPRGMMSVDTVVVDINSPRRRRVVMRASIWLLVRLVLLWVVLLVRLLSMKLVSILFASVLSARRKLRIIISFCLYWCKANCFLDSEDSSDREEQEEREAELRREAYEDGREDQAEYDEEYYD